MKLRLNKKNQWVVTVLFSSLALLVFACHETISGPLTNINLNKIFFISNRDGNPDPIFTSHLNNDIFVMDADGKNQTNLTNSPDSDFTGLVFSEKSEKILYRYVKTGASFYFIMDTNGMNKKIITLTDRNNFGACFSPNGREIIYVSQNPQNDIIITNLDGNMQINLTSNTGIESVNPKFSSDGRRICFSGGSVGNFGPNNIFIIDNDGTNLKQLTNDTLSYYNNIFSLDDNHIYFTGWYMNSGGMEIFSINVDGTHLRQLTNANYQFLYSNLEFSPDGKKLLFTKFDQNISNIYKMDIDGSNLEKITSSEMASGGTYTKDGENIFYQENINGSFQIYIMNYDGSQKMNLSNNSFKDVHPIPNF